MSFIRNPRVTLDLIARDQSEGLEDHRILVIGQKLAAGSASTGLNRDIPRTDAEINTMFGARSHLAMVLRNLRKINPVTNVDAIALADAVGTAGTAVLAVSGTATAARTIYVAVVSATNHRYKIDVASGDTAATVAGKINTAAGADNNAPFTAGIATATVTFTAANKGTLCNNWLISVMDEYDRPVAVPGLTFTLTGWTGGATDPTLTTIFDDVALIRYQTVLYPGTYTLTNLVSFMNARKNVNNNLLDGTAYVYSNDTFANVKSAALAANSSEVVIMTNESNNLSYWKGPHIPEAPDVIAAKFAAAVARRFEDGFSISDLVVTNEPNDQFGGMSKASLPYFNTPLLDVLRPLNGSGYSYEEQYELEDNGVTVVGYNSQNNAVIMGQVVTTFLNDAAGNLDDTWKYLEWRHTHGVIREYMVLNCRKEFSQYRLTRGQAVAGFAMASEEVIRAYLYQLYDELAEQALTVKGREYRKLFEERLKVVLVPEQRRVTIAADTPMVSQLGEIIGSIKFNFDVGAAV